MKELALVLIIYWLGLLVISNAYDYNDIDDNQDDYAEDRSYDETENEERVFIGVNSVFNFIANPTNEGFFIIRMTGQIVCILIGYAITHLISWDYNDTRPGEELSLTKMFNFFTNPENAMLGTTVLIGHAICASALLFIPTIFWRGAPIPENPTVVNFARSEGRCSTRRSSSAILDSFPMNWRSIMSPHVFIRTMIVMSIEHAGFLLFWFLSPIFTGSGFTTTSTNGRCVRDVDQFDMLSHSEEFILDSVYNDLNMTYSKSKAKFKNYN